MADLLALSARYIDNNEFPGAEGLHRPTAELSEVAEGVAFMEAFSNVVVLTTEAGLVLFDTSLEAFATPLLTNLRRYTEAPVHTLVYTHGHVDHVGGAGAFVADTLGRGGQRPRVVGHANVNPRLDRYQTTAGHNLAINLRQFGGPGMASTPQRFGPEQWVPVDTSFDEHLQLRIGDTRLDLHHDRGETDDHLWAFIPELKAVAVGDFVTWVFPNAGNPQKVQRYPAEWARALRRMAALRPELLLPAHGLPIAGADRIQHVLDDLARALESLVDQTLAMMNAGETLDAILHTVRVPEDLIGRPFMQPIYDEPEFVVRNIWRLYGGWHDGDPAFLKPAPKAALASELVALAGGASALSARARVLSSQAEHRLACHLVELAVQACPDDMEAHAARADVYRTRRDAERSLMSRGIYGAAVHGSEARLKAGHTPKG